MNACMKKTKILSPVLLSPYNQLLINLIDEQYTRTRRSICSPRMTVWLKSQGYNVNHKRVKKLMNIMGIEAIYPKRNQAGQIIRIKSTLISLKA